MSDFLQIHAQTCAGWRDPAGDFDGCDCHVWHAADLQAERDQLRADIQQVREVLRESELNRRTLREAAAASSTEIRCLVASRDELRRSQDLFIRHLAQPSRFRSYIQPRLVPVDGGLDVRLLDGQVVGHVTERTLGGYLATFLDASWAVPFPTQAQAVDWLTELAQYAAWADLQQAAAAAVEEE